MLSLNKEQVDERLPLQVILRMERPYVSGSRRKDTGVVDVSEIRKIRPFYLFFRVDEELVGRPFVVCSK